MKLKTGKKAGGDGSLGNWADNRDRQTCITIVERIKTNPKDVDWYVKKL